MSNFIDRFLNTGNGHLAMLIIFWDTYFDCSVNAWRQVKNGDKEQFRKYISNYKYSKLYLATCPTYMAWLSSSKLLNISFDSSIWKNMMIGLIPNSWLLRTEN